MSKTKKEELSGEEMSPQQKFQDARASLNTALIEREDEVDVVLTALLAQENPLLVGPPGSAKSLLLDSLMSWVQPAKKFSILLNKFTMPEEVFGPISLQALKTGTYERISAGRLQEADLSFADEIFKASSAILNTTLRIMNERVIEDGKGGWQKCPLLMLVAGSNEFPDGQELGALFDRFLLRKKVAYIREEKNRNKLIWTRSHTPTFTSTITPDEIQEACKECKQVKFPLPTRGVFDRIRKSLWDEGIRFSDRRLYKSVSVCQCYAYLNGSNEVKPEHLTILQHVLWEDPAESPEKASKIVNKIANPIGSLVAEKRQEAADVVAKQIPREAIEKLEAILEQLELVPDQSDVRVEEAVQEISQLLSDSHNRNLGRRVED